MHSCTLEPYKGSGTRYTCPECGHKHAFTRYISVSTGEHVADHVGRCNREVNCGYHYKPKDFHKDTGSPLANFPDYTPQPRKPTSYIAPAIYEQSFVRYDENNFVQFLTARFGREVTTALVNKYHIGTSKHWPGATVFWQLDKDCRVRTGKIMLYDGATGKRIKQPFNHIHWVHSLLRLPDYELRQCLFGEHLLGQHAATDADAGPLQVAIVESEKTAIIASVYLPQFTWLACGSLAGLTFERFKVLQGHNVTLFPDLNCYDKWKEKAKELDWLTSINVAHLLEVKATAEEKACGLDLADYLLRHEINHEKLAA